MKPKVSPCVTCGDEVTQRPGQGRARKYCTNCRSRSSGERGYGPAHQRARREWQVLVEAGIDCCLCGSPIESGQTWHLDHTEDRTAYRGAAHAHCNLRDGQLRSALTVIANRYNVDRAALIDWLESSPQNFLTSDDDEDPGIFSASLPSKIRAS